MPINPLKSLFSRKSTADSAKEQMSPDSPRYAYAFPSPYKRPRILVLVDEVAEPYFLSFHYVLLRLHNTESLAFFVLESAEVSHWTKQKSPEAFVEQVVADTQPTLVIFSGYGLPHGDVLPALFKAKNAAIVCQIDSPQAASQMIEQADLVYAATPYLGDRLSTQFPERTVFSSAQSTPYLDFLISTQPSQESLTIGYAGSKENQADLKAIASDIAKILTDYPQVQFETVGTISMPEALASFKKRVHTHKAPADYAAFLNKLQQLNWAIGLLPLQDTESNRCKTPSKYLAYTACGIATAASDGIVYGQFETELETDRQILLTQPDQWYGNMQKLIDSEAQRTAIVTNAQTYCQQNFSLEMVEAQIKELIALA